MSRVLGGGNTSSKYHGSAHGVASSIYYDAATYYVKFVH